MRPLDWPERLAAMVEEARNKPFAWGSHDCALWACSVIAMLTDIDPAESVRGTYQTTVGAVRALRELGGHHLRDVALHLADLYDFPEIPPAMAQRGDLVLCPSGAEWPEALGVCLGAKAAITGATRLTFVPMSTALLAWRI